MTVTSLDSEWNNLAALPMDIIISYSLHPINLCRKTGVLFLPANQHAPLLHLGSFLRQQGGIRHSYTVSCHSCAVAKGV